MSVPCTFNCTNQTSDGYCKTTVCIHPIYSQKHFQLTTPEKQQIDVVGESRYSVSLAELRQSIRSVCAKLYIDESVSNFMYIQLLQLIQTEITYRCTQIR